MTTQDRTRYFLTSKLELIETVRRAIDCGITDVRVIDCSGHATGYYVDMDLACVLDEQGEKYVTEFAEIESNPSLAA